MTSEAPQNASISEAEKILRRVEADAENNGKIKREPAEFRAFLSGILNDLPKPARNARLAIALYKAGASDIEANFRDLPDHYRQELWFTLIRLFQATRLNNVNAVIGCFYILGTKFPQFEFFELIVRFYAREEIIASDEIIDIYLDFLHKRAVADHLIWILILSLFSAGRSDEAMRLVEENRELLRSLPIPACVEGYHLAAIQLFKSTDVRADPKERIGYTKRQALSEALIKADWQKAKELSIGTSARALIIQACDLSQASANILDETKIDQEIFLSERANSKGTVIVFTGRGDRFVTPLSVMDVFFSELRLNAIYCRDHQRLLYCNGIRSLAGDLENTRLALKGLHEQLGGGPLYTLGNSAGGFAAILYAAKLEARRSLVFSAPSTIDERDLHVIGETRARTSARRIQALSESGRLAYSDFRLDKILEEAPDNFHVTAICGRDHELDYRHQQRLAGMDKVTARYIDGFTSHASILGATEKWGMMKVMREAFGLPG